MSEIFFIKSFTNVQLMEQNEPVYYAAFLSMHWVYVKDRLQLTTATISSRIRNKPNSLWIYKPPIMMQMI